MAEKTQSAKEAVKKYARADGSHHKKYEFYKLTMVFKCRTKKQCDEAKEAINATYQSLVDKWCGSSKSKKDTVDLVDLHDERDAKLILK